MKKILSLLLILLAGMTIVMAQPQKMTYQMVVRNSNNELIVNQVIGVKVSIYQDTVNGLPAYAETHTTTTNANALMTIQIGTGTPFVLNSHFSEVQWKDHKNYLKIEIDPTGGNSYTIVGSQELVSVPYAFYSESSKYVDTALYAYKSDTAAYANIAYISYTANYADSARISNSAISANTANYADTTRIANTAISANSANSANSAISATYADTAFFLMNAQNSDTAKFAYSSDTADYAINSHHSVYADTALYANNSANAINAVNATYADSTQVADFAHNSDTAVYANTSYSSNITTFADSARISNSAISANTANYADTTRIANTAITSNNANTAISATYADSTQVANFAHNSDTAVYANASYMSNTANYADSARISNSAISANTANYADTTRIANTAISANSANTANSALTANYADTADYNKLLNKPTGINHGDILYWESSDSSWHIVPVGNVGETLTLDSNKTPHWTQNSTQTVALPTITTDTIINITTNSAKAIGSVTADGGSPFVFSGICWDTAHNPTTADFHTLDGIGLGSISSNLLGLTMGQYYYVRAFATNSAGTAYGNELVFRTQTYPAVTTNIASNISITTALSGGDVTDDGGAPILARGVCWNSTSTAPTIADSHTSDGTGIGIYSSVLSSLARNTKYYVRAYATNYIGTSYGDTISFTTLADFPTVTTAAVSSITSVTAVVGGNVTDDGDATVTTRGICYNTTGNPTIADNILPIGSGTGSFSATLSGLTASTVYYVCAYATNSIGTSYGATISFTSADPWTCGISTITDYDNNVYNTVQLGTQCWMKENLRTTHYANGTAITLGSSTSSYVAYAYHVGGNSSNDVSYGLLYNWYATTKGINSSTDPSGIQGICPNGWHVPSNSEWTKLFNYIGTQSQYTCNNNSNNVSKALASKIGWNTNSSTCTPGNTPSNNNSTGFGAMPGGWYSGSYYSGDSGLYWTATISSGTSALRIWFAYDNAVVVSGDNSITNGEMVRCLKD